MRSVPLDHMPASQHLNRWGVLPVLVSVPLGTISPPLVRAQESNSPAVTARTDDRISDAMVKAFRAGFDWTLESAKLDKSFVEWGTAIAAHDLQIATWERNLRLKTYWNLTHMPEFVSTQYDQARAQARYYLLRSQFDLAGAKYGSFYFNHITPHETFAFNSTSKALPWFDLIHEAIDMTTNPIYQSQPAELNYRAMKFQFEGISTLMTIGNSAAANVLGPASAFYHAHERLRDLQLELRASDYQHDAQLLAFGGVLATAALPPLHFNGDYDHFSGSFGTIHSGSPLALTGAWASRSDSTTDRFTAASRYTFNELDTTSGHVVSGYGIASRHRVEHQNAAVNPLELWNARFTQDLTETTRRYESYNIRSGPTTAHPVSLSSQLSQDFRAMAQPTTLTTSISSPLASPSTDSPLNDLDWPKKRQEVFNASVLPRHRPPPTIVGTTSLHSVSPHNPGGISFKPRSMKVQLDDATLEDIRSLNKKNSDDH